MNNPPFTAEDKAFLRAILDVPDDRHPWLVYADWLDDRGDPRAEFLRLSVERDETVDAPTRAAHEARLADLWAALDPRWLMIFDTPRIGNCPGSGWPSLPCPETWDRLTATETPDIRMCTACRRAVHYCDTLNTARAFAGLGVRVVVSSRADAEGQQLFEPPVEEPPEDDSDEWVVFERDLPDEPDEPPPTDRPESRPWWRFW